MLYINSGTGEYNHLERWRASEGGRATEGARYVCTQQYLVQQYLWRYLLLIDYW